MKPRQLDARTRAGDPLLFGSMSPQFRPFPRGGGVHANTIVSRSTR